jgi:phosphoribosylformylglycinamidine synthase
MDFKRADSAIVLVGATHEELGGSHYFRVCGGGGSDVPNVDLPRARDTFRAVHRAMRDGLILAAHDLSEGGLAVALAEMAFAGDIGCEIELDRVPGANEVSRTDAVLFSESNSRFLLEVDASRVAELLGHFGDLPAAAIGRTVESTAGTATVCARDGRGNDVLCEELEDLKAAWKSLSEFLAGDR